MKSASIQQIEGMDDFRLLRFFNFFTNTLFNNVNTELEEITAQVPEGIKNMPELETVLKHEEQYYKPIEQKEAIEFARTSFLEMANDENTEPALAEAIKNYRDPEQPAGVILALGAAVSFILLLSTSKIKYQSGKGWEINVGGNRDPKELESVTALIKELFKVIPNSILELTKTK